MSMYELSWYLKIDQQRNCGINPRATLADSLPQVKKALDHAGVVSISLLNCPELGRQRLQLFTEHGQSVVTLGKMENQPDWIRGFSWSKPSSQPTANDIHARSAVCNPVQRIVCDKAESVYKLIEEFFSSGQLCECN